MEQVIETIVGYLWSDALVYLALIVGIYFTVITRGIQFRYFREMFRVIREKKEDSTGISPRQALFMALAGRIGVGNIAGVAFAIGMGGPGAIFWMIVMGFLGSALAFSESTIAQLYKFKEGDQYYGGVHYYIDRGLKLKPFAAISALILIVAYTVMMPGIQMNTIATTFKATFDIPPYVSGIFVTIGIGLIIWGGVKSIARAAEKIVPTMSGLYVLAMVVLLIAHYDQIPATFMLIIKSAFGMDAVFGAIIGHAVNWGVRRAVFASAAGAGESTFASAAAMTSHPVKQGLIQAFSIFFETAFILTSSGLMVLITGMYNVTPPGSSTPLVENVPGVAAGAEWTSLALQTTFHQAGSWLISLAILVFAFTTLMTYYYIAESGISYFDRKGKYPIIKTIAKIASLIALFMGSIMNTKTLWALGDITFGSMAYVNLITLVLLSKPLMKALKDYDYQRKLGLDPVFDPRKAGIQDAGYWEAYADKKNASNSAVINNDQINSIKKNSDRKSA
ncbi:alanine/glycine:cation symporter family protein [Acinetobacter kanungonis]|uniref:alanine/glycine:cation symporter family protein n=1 Tax=Acinetobacter kanungonis TaxID=2699469 RepID=UPI00137AF4D6|nr:alanine/glycine:cation symporter family protein [Acinetobacter kanungonis]NCI77012.1 alanine:cation symporter family protein [Acinetobacter kanungonis]